VWNGEAFERCRRCGLGGATASANPSPSTSTASIPNCSDADQNIRELTINTAGVGTQSVDLAGHALHIYSPTLARPKFRYGVRSAAAAASPLDGIFDSTLASHINARVGLGHCA